MRLSEFLIFVGGLLVSVFLLGLGAGQGLSGESYPGAPIFFGLAVNGLVHIFFWKKFWNLLKSLKRP